MNLDGRRGQSRGRWCCGPVWAFTALLLLLSTTLAQGLGDEAATVLRQGQQKAAQAMVTYTDHFPDQPLWREAVALGERARRLAPEQTEPNRFLGQVYSVTGWYSRAWESWQRYRELGGEMDAQARTQLLAAATWLGFRSYSTGDYQRAITYLEEAFALNPQDRLTLSRLTQSYLSIGDPEAARPYAESLATLDGGSDSLLERVEAYLAFGVEAVDAVNQGESLYAEGRPEDALRWFDRAIELNPAYADALDWAGRVALELDRPADAADYLQRLVELDPGDDEAQTALNLARNRARFGEQAYSAYTEGLSAYERGDTARAEQLLLQALQANSEIADAHALLGRIEFARGNFERALVRFRQAASLAPDESSYLFYISTTEDQLRQQQEAQALAQQRERAEAEERARAAEAARLAQQEAEEQARAEAAARERAAEQAAAEQAAAEQAAAERAAAEQPAAEPAPPQQSAGAQAAELPRLEENEVAGGAVPAPSSDVLVIANQVITHVSAEEGGSGAFSFIPGENLERNLTSPVDFTSGTLFERLEVLSKPSDVPVHYQLCLVPNDSISVQPACTSSDQLVFNEEGVFEAQQPLASMSGFQGIDWGNGLESVILVIKDPSGLPVDSRYLLGDGNQEPPDPELYYPMEVRFTAMVVPEGMPFPGWPQ